MDPSRPIEEWCVRSSHQEFQNVCRDKNFKEYACGVYPRKGDEDKDNTIDQLRDHGTEVVADPEMLWKTLAPDVEGPDIVPLGDEVGSETAESDTRHQAEYRAEGRVHLACKVVARKWMKKEGELKKDRGSN